MPYLLSFYTKSGNTLQFRNILTTTLSEQPWHPDENGALSLREGLAGEIGSKALLAPAHQHQHLHWQGRCRDGLQPRDCDRVIEQQGCDADRVIGKMIKNIAILFSRLTDGRSANSSECQMK